MKIKIIKTIISAFAALGLVLFPTALAFAADSCSPDVCSGNYPASVKAACGCPGSSTGSESQFSNTLVNILNGIIGILGTVAVVFIIIGGVGYITSAGDAGKLKKAKDTILYACIGLAICALAFAIVNFAIGILNNSTAAPASGDTGLLKNSIAFSGKTL